MQSSNRFRIKHIIESLEVGQFEQAKDQLQQNCKTKPERQAVKLAQVVGALCERGQNDLAARFMNQFDKG